MLGNETFWVIFKHTVCIWRTDGTAAHNTWWEEQMWKQNKARAFRLYCRRNWSSNTVTFLYIFYNLILQRAAGKKWCVPPFWLSSFASVRSESRNIFVLPRELLKERKRSRDWTYSCPIKKARNKPKKTLRKNPLSWSRMLNEKQANEDAELRTLRMML